MPGMRGPTARAWLLASGCCGALTLASGCFSSASSGSGPGASFDAVVKANVYLTDLANFALERSEPLPRPDPSITDPDADIEEPIHLHL